MNTKDNQRSRLTRMLLKNAYMDLMHRGPAGKITVKDICEGAQVNRSTFYLYYREPNDILMELEDRAIGTVTESLNSIGALNGVSPDVSAYLLSFLHDIRMNDELFRTLLADNSDPNFRRKLQGVALDMAETAFDLPLSPDTKNGCFLFLVSGSIELLVDWIKSGYAASEQAMCNLLLSLCEGSLRSVCG